MGKVMRGFEEEIEIEYRQPAPVKTVDIKKLPVWKKGMSGTTHDLLWWVIQHCSESGKLYAGWRNECRKDLGVAVPTLQLCIKTLERVGALKLMKRQAQLNMVFFDYTENQE